MNHRPMSRILDEVSHERGKQAKLGRKLRANRDRNWLLALTLNTFAKAADDLPPTTWTRSSSLRSRPRAWAAR